jgi:hypothetical protein
MAGCTEGNIGLSAGGVKEKDEGGRMKDEVGSFCTGSGLARFGSVWHGLARGGLGKLRGVSFRSGKWWEILGSPMLALFCAGGVGTQRHTDTEAQRGSVVVRGFELGVTHDPSLLRLS